MVKGVIQYGFLRKPRLYTAYVRTFGGTSVTMRNFDASTGVEGLCGPDPDYNKTSLNKYKGSQQPVEPFESISVKLNFQVLSWTVRQVYVIQKALTGDEITKSSLAYEGGAMDTTEFSYLKF